jgi:hypothetical protein
MAERDTKAVEDGKITTNSVVRHGKPGNLVVDRLRRSCAQRNFHFGFFTSPNSALLVLLDCVSCFVAFILLCESFFLCSLFPKCTAFRGVGLIS